MIISLTENSSGHLYPNKELKTAYLHKSKGHSRRSLARVSIGLGATSWVLE
jgi:hypothetical protein